MATFEKKYPGALSIGKDYDCCTSGHSIIIVSLREDGSVELRCDVMICGGRVVSDLWHDSPTNMLFPTFEAMISFTRHVLGLSD